MALPVVKLDHPATIEDLDALPEHLKGEIIDGVLYAVSRPGALHQAAAGRLHTDLATPYERGRSGPGWWILPEPGVELAHAPEVAPDIAGWRRERLPTLPDHRITVVPDWVCELLSTSTRGYHYLRKRPLYAQAGVGHLWEVDLEARVVIVSRLESGRWVDAGTYGEGEPVRIPPFDAVEVILHEWLASGAAGEQ